MNIITKFGINDDVYAADLYYDRWFANKDILTVSEIIIRNKGEIIYRLWADEYTTSSPEEMCFHTYEECKQWCNKMNGEKQKHNTATCV